MPKITHNVCEEYASVIYFKLFILQTILLVLLQRKHICEEFEKHKRIGKMQILPKYVCSLTFLLIRAFTAQATYYSTASIIRAMIIFLIALMMEAVRTSES
jgi:hypothetical protein